VGATTTAFDTLAATIATAILAVLPFTILHSAIVVIFEGSFAMWNQIVIDLSIVSATSTLDVSVSYLNCTHGTPFFVRLFELWPLFLLTVLRQTLRFPFLLVFTALQDGFVIDLG